MERRMKKGFVNRSPLVLAVLIFSLIICSNTFAGSKHHHGHWSYEGETGPGHWGELSEKFEACSKGTSQSPINIEATATEGHGEVEFHYSPSRIKILNNGHAVQVNYDKGSYIKVDGKRYDLLQFHFHSPSEHTVDGKHAAIEMHLVHKSKDGQLAVVGVLIEKGGSNGAYKDVWANLPEEEGHEKVTKATVNAVKLLPAKKTYYTYSGSLTTPPCSENVAWFVMKTPVKLSGDQIKAFMEIMHGDNRPTQPLNGRKVM